MKRLLVIIAILLLAPVVACAREGKSVCVQYLDALRLNDFGAAYDLISPDVQASADDPERGENTFTREEFIEKHNVIFNDLGVYSVSVTAAELSEGELLSTLDYTLTYRTIKYGDLTFDYSMIASWTSAGWRVEWSPALIFPQMQWGDTVRLVTTPAVRGEILADGEAIATNTGYISVYAVPSKITDKALFVTQLSGMLNMTVEDVEKQLKKAYNDLAVIKQFYQGELSDVLREQLLTVTGVGVDDGNFGTYRDYPYGELLAHFVGYTGYATPEQVIELNVGRSEEDGLYTTDSRVGKLGLEKQYETELRGRDGFRVIIRAEDGSTRAVLYKKDSVDGSDVLLTVDFELQQRTEELLRLVMFGDDVAGAVVVLDPTTGAVEAMASYPTYDVNRFARGMSTEEYAAMSALKYSPQYNRVTQGLYPPGSVFKPFIAAAALQADVASVDYVFSGDIEDDYWTPTEYGRWVWTPIKRTRVRNRTTPMNMRNSMLHSDNIYFASLALKLGAEGLTSFVTGMGLGEAIPFELPVGTSQFLNEETELTLKLLADSGYGQGEILLSPLQAAASFSAFANGGDIPVPYMVDSLWAGTQREYERVWQNEAKTWKTGIISSYSLSKIVSMLEDVVNSDYNGTGRNLRATGCTVAGKTGTAEIGSNKSREISWFAGFRVGAEDGDERLVLVMLEVPADEEHSSLKLEIARHLLSMPSD